MNRSLMLPWTPRALSVAAGACLAAPALAQSLISNDSGWLLQTGTTAPYFTYTQAGSGTLAGNAPTEFHRVQSGVLVRAGATAAAQRTNAASDQGSYSLRYERSFILKENADVWLAQFLSAQVTKAGLPPNTISAGAVARVEVFKQGVGNTWVPTGIFNELRLDDQVANGTWELKDGAKMISGALTADATKKYTVRAEVLASVAGVGAGAGPSGTVDTKGFNAGREGQAASFALTPSGLNYDSRKGVGVDAARRYGLTGKDIKIGIIEPGNPYTGQLQHVDTPAIDLNNGGVAGQHMSEHATAVAGILASKNAALDKQGVAPSSRVVSAALSSYASNINVWSNLVTAGCTVINMSAGTELGQQPDDWLQRWRIDSYLNTRPDVAFVVSAGNDGAPAQGQSTVTNQGGTLNGISVGALNRDGKAWATFSSFSRTDNLAKPDIVAPGEYILTTATRDVDGVAGNNDYRRVFMGGDFDRKDGTATAGETSGTSFAAPFVAGAAALMQEYAKMAPQTHDARAYDSRVIKAVMLNSASTNVLDSGGGKWQQYRDKVDVNGKQTDRVWRSLNTQLGAGALDIGQAMYTYATPEARAADDAAGRNVKIDLATNQGKLERDRYWDLQHINKPAAEANGWATVDYLLGTLTGPVPLRTTLAWQTQASLVNNAVFEQTPVLNLYLFQEGAQDGNVPGWDPTKPNDDTLVVFTQENTGTVRLIDMLLALNGRYYLQVRSELILNDQFFQRSDFDFGIAVTVPASGFIALVGPGALIASLRRRRVPAPERC